MESTAATTKFACLTLTAKLLALSLLLLLVSLASSLQAADQPKMRDAIELLESAKYSKTPLAALESAHRKLDNGRPNKKGERLEAMEYVNEAIEFAKQNNHSRMRDKIDNAISHINKGIDKAK